MRMLLSSFLLFVLLMAGVLSISVAAPSNVAAVDVFGACKISGADKTSVCESSKSENPFTKVLKVVISILSIVIGAAAVVVIVLSSFKMIRSNGNAQEVAGAKNGIIYAIVGLIIAGVAPLIVGYIISKV